MEEQETSGSGLKVSDRRHFTESGERRAGVEAFEGETAPAKPVEKTVAAASAKPAATPASEKKTPPPRAERLAAREINYAGLLQDLYATGMIQLGAEMQPGQRGQVDLEGARETIDLLGMLQQKTHGNLDAQEEQIMNAVLYELRMAYVEVQRAATSRVQPARVAPPPPPPHRR